MPGQELPVVMNVVKLVCVLDNEAPVIRSRGSFLQSVDKTIPGEESVFFYNNQMYKLSNILIVGSVNMVSEGTYKGKKFCFVK